MRRLHLGIWAVALAGVFAAQGADSPASGGAAKPSSAIAQVARLAESGVGDDVVLTFVKNLPEAFRPSADDILYLKNKGVSSAVISAILSHDATLNTDSPAGNTPPAKTDAVAEAPDATAPETQTMQDPPAEVAYFYDALASYGVWVQMDNFGWCWQPREAMNLSWRPYCDGGRWKSTDSGWFWESDYKWGETAFHYGRWALISKTGWVWAPDRTWGSAWVVWRTVDDVCGWAPLPPRSVFNSRSGWRFNDLPVSSTFDFGLRQECYTFVPLKEFTQHDLGARRLGVAEVARVWGRTTIINGYTFENQTLVNQGIPTKQVSAATHAPIPQVVIHDLPYGTVMPPPLEGRAMLYRPELRAPLRPPLVEFQRVDQRHPFIHHRGMGGPPGVGGPRGPQPGPGAGPRPGGGGPSPAPSSPGAGKGPGGGSPPGKKTP